MEFCLTGRWEISLAGFRDAGQIFEEKCSGVAWEMSTIRVFTLWNLLYLGRYTGVIAIGRGVWARLRGERRPLPGNVYRWFYSAIR